MSPPQLSLSLRDPRWRPVMAVNGVMAALDLRADEIDALLDTGDLAGWNIAVDPRGRRELRILTQSVDHYAVTQGSRPKHWDLSAVLPLMRPPRSAANSPVLFGTDVWRALNCDEEHVTNLIRAGQLAVRPGTTFGPGRNGSPVILATSYEAFLKRRWLT